MTVPWIGFGTSPWRAGGARVDVEESVRMAWRAGFRLFDVAAAYGNERAIGRALRGVRRSELQLVGKLWRTDFHPQRVRRACEESLQRLGVDAFDLYLLHAPDPAPHVAPLADAEEIGWDELLRRAMPSDLHDTSAGVVPVTETWSAMAELATAGLASRIGVSNFTPAQIAALGEPLPAANEIPCWPHDPDAVAWHRDRGALVLGYSPLKREVLESPAVMRAAAEARCTPAQAVLRWLVAQGIRPLTASSDAAHIRESLQALDIELAPEDIARIGSALSALP